MFFFTFHKNGFAHRLALKQETQGISEMAYCGLTFHDAKTVGQSLFRRANKVVSDSYV